MICLRDLCRGVLSLGLLLGAAPGEARPSAPAVLHASSESGDPPREVDEDDGIIAAIVHFLVSLEPVKHPVSHAGKPRTGDGSIGLRRLGMVASPLFQGGTELAAYAALEGHRLGLQVDGALLQLPLSSTAFRVHDPKFTRVHLTYALLSRDRARLRVEAGASALHLPGKQRVGASVGLSMQACVGGPLDWDVRLQATPYPYWQFDGRSSLALRISVLSLQAGLRWLVVDETGLWDRRGPQSSLAGPYLGLGVEF